MPFRAWGDQCQLPSAIMGSNVIATCLDVDPVGSVGLGVCRNLWNPEPRAPGTLACRRERSRPGSVTG